MTSLTSIVLDVGQHMICDIEEALECLKLLIQKKFFAEKKEEISLILCGTEATSNPFDDESDLFSNISVVRELKPIDWDILEFLNGDQLLSPFDGDVLAAVKVAMADLVEQGKKRKGILQKRILLVSNLGGHTDKSLVSSLIDEFQSAEICLSLIGFELPEDATDFKPDDPESSDQSAVDKLSSSDRLKRSKMDEGNTDKKTSPSLASVQSLWTELNGESYSFNDAIPALAIFETRSVVQRAWKVNFQIGDSLTLPVAGFTQVREARPPTLKLLHAFDPSVPIRTVTTYHASGSATEQLDPSEVVRGFQYGNTMVPFTKEDMAAVKSDSEKCLCLIGFTDASNVPRYLYTGDSVLVFVADAKPVDEGQQDPGATALSALAQAMYEMNSVALVRRVYNRVSAPRIGVLMPDVRNNQVSLVYTDLAFAEDVRTFEFPSLPISAPTGDENVDHPIPSCSYTHTTPPTSSIARSSGVSADHLEAMNKYIDSMMLGKSASDSDEDSDNDNPSSSQPDVKPEWLPNPWIQRLFTCFRERGLNHVSDLVKRITNPESSEASKLQRRNFPGLENVVDRLNANDEDEEASDLIHARANLTKVLPPLSNQNENAQESGQSLAKRRKLMAAELFGISSTDDTNSSINDESVTSQLSSTISQGSSSRVTDVGSIDPVGDFDALIGQDRLNYACQRMQDRIIQLVTDPYTGSLLRPKAIACLVVYRQRALERGTQLAESYNMFVRAWREDLELRGLFPCTNVQLSSYASDPRLGFWMETITREGLGLISHDKVSGVRLSRSEVDEFMNPTAAVAQLNPSVPLVKKSHPDETEIDDLIDEMD